MSRTEKIKKAVAWCTKPIIRVTFITSEERMFLEHANKFLDPSAIKQEHRKEKK